MDKVKEKIDNLKALRNNYFNTLFLVSGGTIGLIFQNEKTFMHGFFILAGFLFSGLIVRSIRKNSDFINELIERG